MPALFRTFFPVLALQKLLKLVKIWQSSSTLLRFMNHGKNVGFNFIQVWCAHKSGDVVNFTTVACRISSRLKWYKNYTNRLRLAKVITKNKLPRFYGSLCMLMNKVFEITLACMLYSSSHLSHIYQLLYVLGNLDLVGLKQVFKAENNPWVPPIEDQLQIGVSHVFDYIRTDTYKL